jgi:hypothetical protein
VGSRLPIAPAVAGVAPVAEPSPVLRAWFAARNGTNATTAEFTALARRVSRVNLSHFFDVWLYRSGKPAGW